MKLGTKVVNADGTIGTVTYSTFGYSVTWKGVDGRDYQSLGVSEAELLTYWTPICADKPEYKPTSGNLHEALLDFFFAQGERDAREYQRYLDEKTFEKE